MTVTAIEARTYVEFRGQPTYVWSACPKAIVAYVCLSHPDVDLPTVEHLRAHCRGVAGEHVAGRLCSHGLEAMPAKESAAKREREPGEEPT